MARPKPNLTPEQIKARQAKWVQNWREKYPEKQVQARKKAYINRKIKAFKVLGEVRCVHCGCDDVDFLEFNHKNGGGCKEWRETGGTPIMDQVLTNKRVVDDLEILCRVCNARDYLERKYPNKPHKFLVIYHK